MSHIPVLLHETIAALNIKSDGVYIDGTFGRGGHSTALLTQLGPQGRLIALDCDPQAHQSAPTALVADKRFSLLHLNFAQIDMAAKHHHVLGQVDGILLDIGVSSPQLDEAHRGFSFMQDGPLDMRMDPTRGQSAQDWLATAEAVEIAKVLKTLGEERFAKRIAQAIVRTRQIKPLKTTHQLAEIVKEAVPFAQPGKHPATRTFQAIRIHINQELEVLETALQKAYDILAPGGRIAVITFHSLEDRIVKRFFRQESSDNLPRDLPVRAADIQHKMRLTHKRVKPSSEEITQNPRARSATLRVAEKL